MAGFGLDCDNGGFRSASVRTVYWTLTLEDPISLVVDETQDYYEVLQISPNAEPETVHRVYRLLAARFHPDNAETGSEERFRLLVEAYRVLGDPEGRAKYDVIHLGLKTARWRLLSSNTEASDDFEAEQLIRLTVLELLYTNRRTELDNPGVALLDIEALTGRAREHLEFTVWYLNQKKYITRSDGSRLVITVDGVEYLEKTFQEATQRRRLNAGPTGVRV